MHAFLKSRWFYPAVFLACAWPLVLLLRDAIPVLVPAFLPDVVVPWDGDLGVNPVEMLLHETGRDALLLLIASLAITPIRRLTGWNRVQLVRRTVGVWSFVYACLHFLTYTAFDKLGDVRAIADDVVERRFIFSGMLAFAILLVLTVTSTNGMMRRLGRRWARLHKTVYLASIAGAIHFAWGQKAALGEPLLWASVLLVLLSFRVVVAVRRARPASSVAVSR